jgi:hypothetical protein
MPKTFSQDQFLLVEPLKIKADYMVQTMLDDSHFMKISKLKELFVFAKGNNHSTAKSIYKLLCADEIFVATRLAVNMVVVKMHKRSKTIPRQSNSTLLWIKFVANAVPVKTMITEIFLVEGLFFLKSFRIKHHQTVCINKTLAIETVYLT